MSARLISLQEQSPDPKTKAAARTSDADVLASLQVPNPRLSKPLKDPATGRVRQELVKLTRLQLLLEFVEYYYRGLGSSLYKTCLQAALMYMAKDQIALATKTMIVQAAGLTAGGAGGLGGSPGGRHKLVGAGGRPVR